MFLNQVLTETPEPLTNCLVAGAPLPNQSTTVSREMVAAAVRRQVPQTEFTNWSGAASVKVSRRLRQFEETELKDLLTITLQREQARDRGDLELRLSRPWLPIPIPDEPITLRVIELPVAGLTPNFIARFELRTDREILGTWQMPLQAKLWKDIWVARSPLLRGTVLSDADLARERRDLLTLRDAWLPDDAADGSLELAENLSPGMPLLQRSVRMRPVIRKGRVLEAVVQDGSLMITLRVEALQDGLPGQLIRVRNPKSKKEFHAKVQNEQTVLVAL